MPEGLTERVYRQRRESTEPKVQTQLPESVHRLAKSKAALRGQTLTDWLAAAVHHYAETSRESK